MNYLLPERLDALARDYVVGTLSARAARRFARVVASSAVAADAVVQWQHLLGALEEGAPASAAPRPQVWTSVQRRLFDRDEAARAVASERGARGLGRAAAGWLRFPLGLVAGGLLLLSLLLVRPQLLGLEWLSHPAPAGYVGVLQDAQGRPVLATSAGRYARVLTVTLLRSADGPCCDAAPERALTIWAWNDSDTTPRRIGSWRAGPMAELPLPERAEAVLATMTHLGLSSEVASRAPASPTRPFIAEGPCARIW